MEGLFYPSSLSLKEGGTLEGKESRLGECERTGSSASPSQEHSGRVVLSPQLSELPEASWEGSCSFRATTGIRVVGAG